MKKERGFREKGITLVALVITIIILLILAGVTLNTALSENGLFRMAKKAVNEYQEAEKQEQSALDDISEELDKISIDYNDYIGCYVDGYEPTKKLTGSEFTIKSETSGVTSNQEENGNIIDGVETNGDQKFTTEDLNWRIWDYDKYTKTIRLISDKPTEATLTLKGATGYNNGVWAVNEICRQCYGKYDENKQMKRGISVANLKRTDIQKVSTYDYTQYKHTDNGWEDSTDGTIYFGSSESNYSNPQYPKIWANYDLKWTYGYNGSQETGSDKECEIWEKENGYKKEAGTNTGENTEFKQSYYAHDYKESEFINEEYYNLLFKDNTEKTYFDKIYWLAGRFVQLYKSKCDFGLQILDGYSMHCRVGGLSLCNNGRESNKCKF